MAEGKYSFSIDRGGTFTDVYAATPNGTCKHGGGTAGPIRLWPWCFLRMTGGLPLP